MPLSSLSGCNDLRFFRLTKKTGLRLRLLMFTSWGSGQRYSGDCVKAVDNECLRRTGKVRWSPYLEADTHVVPSIQYFHRPYSRVKRRKKEPNITLTHIVEEELHACMHVSQVSWIPPRGFIQTERQTTLTSCTRSPVQNSHTDSALRWHEQS